MATGKHPGVSLAVSYAAAIINPYQVGSPVLRRPHAVAYEDGISLADDDADFRFYLAFAHVEEVRCRDENGLFIRLVTGEVFYLEVPDRAGWLGSGLSRPRLSKNRMAK